MAIVYIHRRKDIQDTFLNVFYVGIGKFESRSRDKRCRSYHWNNIVSKHGYEIEITHKELCWEESCAIEKYLISFYGRNDLGLGKLVNMTDGGDGKLNNIVTEKQKIHLSKINKGKKHTEESKKKMSESRKGKTWNLGKKMSDETRQKLSLAHTGKKYSEERIAQMRITFGGKNNPMYGRKRETPYNAKKIAQYDIKTGELINTFDSICQAANSLKISKSVLSNYCNKKILFNKRKHEWKYV